MSPHRSGGCRELHMVSEDVWDGQYSLGSSSGGLEINYIALAGHPFRRNEEIPTVTRRENSGPLSSQNMILGVSNARLVVFDVVWSVFSVAFV